MTPRRLILGSSLLVVANLALGARPVSAWGANGHRITAQVAEDHLSAATRQALATLTGGRSLALLATWPDFIRSNPAWDCAKPWHFVTVEDGQALAEALERPADTTRECRELFATLELPQNVVGAIDFFAAVLAGREEEAARFRRLTEELGAEPLDGSLELSALAFLVHFVGDVHQPLHVGRGNDRGGNSITTNWFDDLENLHSVWDEGLIASEGLSFSEFAAFLEQELEGSVPGALAGPADAWAEESMRYRSRVYEIWERTSRDNHLPTLSYDYAARNIGLVKERLYFGGRRLAALLDLVFAPAPGRT